MLIFENCQRVSVLSLVLLERQNWLVVVSFGLGSLFQRTVRSAVQCAASFGYQKVQYPAFILQNFGVIT